MSESNIITEVLRKYNTHNFNYLNNKKYNIIVKYMDMITRFEKKNYICFVNIKNFIEYLVNIFREIRDKILIFIINRVERKFV